MNPAVTTTTRTSRRDRVRRSDNSRQQRLDNDTEDRPRRQLTSESNHSASSSSIMRSSATQRAREERRRRRTTQKQDNEETPRHRRRRSFQKRRSSSSATKDLLETFSGHFEEEDQESRDSMTVSSALTEFTKGIQAVSSRHYSRRETTSSKRRSAASLHSSLSVLDTSSSRLSSSSRHQDRRRRRRRDSMNGSLRRRSEEEEEPMKDDSIRILQFDVSRTGGLSYVDANNVHAKSSHNEYVNNLTILLKEDLVEEDATEACSSSMEGSFHSQAPQLEELTGDEQDKLLADSVSEHSAANNDRLGVRAKKQFNKTVSKLLATPRRRRTQLSERLNMSLATLQI
ncbi:expressed unknown protein [Seminavis robusta]|uniref:Uncharacterized protein n=1 Tax=Seminavis robusta TaxID=568900 RepID=A0A9N8DGD2_9STRA|nr:expressed unknown protein [Seminavis robusta]|eukprot:Sro106_g053460.1 n/a (343) ;mRNA; r:22195-23223